MTALQQIYPSTITDELLDSYRGKLKHAVNSGLIFDREEIYIIESLCEMLILDANTHRERGDFEIESYSRFIPLMNAYYDFIIKFRHQYENIDLINDLFHLGKPSTAVIPISLRAANFVVDRPGSENDTKHYFIWCSHGVSVSPESYLYKMKASHFKSVDFFVEDKTIYNSTFAMNRALTIGSEFNTFLSNRVCKYKCVGDNIYLFPMLFCNSIQDTDGHKSAMGLYYYRKHKTGKYSRKKLMNWHDLELEKIYTYSNIFSLVKRYSAMLSIPDNDVTIGLLCCRAPDEEFYVEYPGFYKMPPEIYRENPDLYKPERALDKQFEIVPDTPPFTIEFRDCPLRLTFFNPQVDVIHQSWKTLADVIHQGCGFNILGFYGLLLERKARERTVCLNIQGLSIFQFADLYENYQRDVEKIDNIAFKIIRCPIQIGSQLIINTLNSLAAIGNTNVAIVMKIYREDKFKDEYSDIGHFVSFFLDDNGNIHFIDPQAKIVPSKEPTEEGRLAHLKVFYDSYMKEFHFCDIMTSCVEKGYEFISFLPTGQMHVRTRPPNLYFGGKDKIPNVEWFNGYNSKKLRKILKELQFNKHIKNLIKQFAKHLPKEFIAIEDLPKKKSKKVLIEIISEKRVPKLTVKKTPKRKNKTRHAIRRDIPIVV
jgi:hypothetical protein